MDEIESYLSTQHTYFFSMTISAHYLLNIFSKSNIGWMAGRGAGSTPV